MRDMKDRAIVCNIGHFDNEIQVSSLQNMNWSEIKPQVDEVSFRISGSSCLPRGALLTTPNRPPVLRHVRLLPVRFWLELWNEGDQYRKRSRCRVLDEKVAALHLAKVVHTVQVECRAGLHIGGNSRARSKRAV